MSTPMFTVIGLLLAAAPAFASVPSCIRDARRSYAECQAGCRETLQTARDACLNRDHDCVEGCRAGRAECVDATGLEAALDACADTLAAARQTCRATTSPDTPERDACIDAAQEVAFQCRDAAREAARPALAACRDGFKACAASCPAGSGTPAENPSLCRREALRAFYACRKGCREDLQVGRDGCLNRDHDCVESCREQRNTCMQPARDQVRSDLAACATARDAAVSTCRSLYADGTPERDQCIDNAQLEAFACRDQAHETAKPLLRACRVAFVECARACPAPTE